MFDVLTPLRKLHRLQYPISDDDEFDAGEWGEVTIVGGDPQLAKITGDVSSVPYAVFQATEGRSDRAFTGQATVIYGTYIADTDQYDTSATFSVTDPLTVEDGVLVPADSEDLIVAWVLIPPGSNEEAPSHLRYTTERISEAP